MLLSLFKRSDEGFLKNLESANNAKFNLFKMIKEERKFFPGGIKESLCEESPDFESSKFFESEKVKEELNSTKSYNILNHLSAR